MTSGSSPKNQIMLSKPTRPAVIATLKYKVSDAHGVGVTVTIRVRNRYNELVKKFVLTNKVPNKLLSKQFRCWLKRGTYKFYVTATDSAGRVSAKAAVNKLKVL